MELKQLDERLAAYIRPQTFPLALKLCTSESELPEKVRIPVRDLGYQVTLCQAIGIARRFRWTLAVGKNDQCCIGGAAAMGFTDASYDAPPEKKLEIGKYSHLLIAPIEAANFDPDVICIYGSPAQMMRLVHAATMGNKWEVSAVAMGVMDCGDIISRTFKSHACQSILPSGGDRVFGGTQDNEAIFTIPAHQVHGIAKGLEDTHKAGFRYPVLTDMRPAPALPPFLQLPKSE